LGRVKFNGRVIGNRLDAPGTLVIIQSLYENVPVRLKQLKKQIKSAMYCIKAFCIRMSLLYAGVTFELFDESM